MYHLSPSSLNIFLECRRCFWLKIRKGVERPEGKFPSLPGGIDKVLKDYFDKFRRDGQLPPELAGKVEGLLFKDMNLLKIWRDWKKGLIFEDRNLNYTFRGALDDCLINNGFYIPLDYKTHGYGPDNPKEYMIKYYQNQLDSYCLLLEKEGFRTTTFAYIFLYYPKIVKENGVIEFNIEPVKIETSIKNAEKNIIEAIKVLNGHLPDRTKCDYCNFVEKFNQAIS